VPIVNDPFAEAIASRKPYQLAVARQIGIPIPKTLISNNSASVRAFWHAQNGNCIYKPLTAPSWTFAETRMLNEEDIAHLEMLRHAPIIVQEKIEKGVDVRVNIFGDAVFAAELSATIPEADLDWRIDSTAQWYDHMLPDAVSHKLKVFLRAINLDYGCIDLRRQPDGEYRFFEINPSGQFLFAEIDTGQPLLRALARLLMAPNRPRPDRSSFNRLTDDAFDTLHSKRMEI
jgi:glutathione synthase/RimK-type ligase-like ATP-grasp enzyme